MGGIKDLSKPDIPNNQASDGLWGNPEDEYNANERVSGGRLIDEFSQWSFIAPTCYGQSRGRETPPSSLLYPSNPLFLICLPPPPDAPLITLHPVFFPLKSF